MLSKLDNLTIDWSDFERAGEITRSALRELSEDRRTLRKLVYDVENDEHLFAKAERHQLLDYIVIYDALDRGFRVRVHLSTDDHRDRPHDHRFHFSSRILRGQYRHTWYRVTGELYDESRAEAARNWMSAAAPDPSPALLDRIEPHLIRNEYEGSTYTLHHAVVHTTVTTPNTVSLFLRGPAEKQRSVIMDREMKTWWWRFGAEDEPPERRRAKRMTHDEYRRFRQRLEELQII